MSDSWTDKYRQAAEQLKPHLLEYLEQLNGGRLGKKYTMRCVLHKDDAPSAQMKFLHNDRSKPRYWCFGCMRDGVDHPLDTVGLHMRLNPGIDFRTAVTELCGMLGVDLDGAETQSGAELRSAVTFQPSAPRPAPAVPAEPQRTEEERQAVRNYVERCQETAIPFPEIHERFKAFLDARGLSPAIADSYGLGFDPDAKFPGPNGTWTAGAVVIPMDDDTYCLRNVNLSPDTPKNARYRNSPGPARMFNSDAFDNGQPVIFVFEGAIDAISAADALGMTEGEVMAINSTSHAATFVEKIRRRQEAGQPVPRLIDALDSDDQGRACAETIRRGLEELGITFYRMPDILRTVKDANELWSNPETREVFRQAIRETAEMVTNSPDKYQAAQTSAAGETADAEPAEQGRNETGEADAAAENGAVTTDEPDTGNVEPDEWTKYQEECRRSVYAHRFIQEDKFRPRRRFSTGMPEVDAGLGGGIPPQGLTILCGQPSCGKSAFAINWADKLAEGWTSRDNETVPGRDVIYFSTEMTHRQLLYRSLSRESARQAWISGQKRGAVSITQLSSGNWENDLEGQQTKVLSVSNDDYLKGAGTHLYTIWACGMRVEALRRLVQKHVDLTGNVPVIFVDYMQNLAPDNGESERQTIERNSKCLVQLSAEFRTPVIAIASLNREGYKNNLNVDITNLKESGNLEYDADCILAIQYYLSKEDLGGKVNPDEVVVTYKKDGSIDKINMSLLKMHCPRNVEIAILKNKDGETGTAVKLQYYPAFNVFTNPNKGSYDFLRQNYQPGGQLRTVPVKR